MSVCGWWTKQAGKGHAQILPIPRGQRKHPFHLVTRCCRAESGHGSEGGRWSRSHTPGWWGLGLRWAFLPVTFPIFRRTTSQRRCMSSWTCSSSFHCTKKDTIFVPLEKKEKALSQSSQSSIFSLEENAEIPQVRHSLCPESYWNPESETTRKPGVMPIHLTDMFPLWKGQVNFNRRHGAPNKSVHRIMSY